MRAFAETQSSSKRRRRKKTRTKRQIKQSYDDEISETTRYNIAKCTRESSARSRDNGGGVVEGVGLTSANYASKSK